MQRASTLQAALHSVDKTKRTTNLRWRMFDQSNVLVTTLRETEFLSDVWHAPVDEMGESNAALEAPIEGNLDCGVDCR